MKKVLVTGATGFVGSHLTDALIINNYDVYALERYMTARYVQGEKRRINTLYADLNDHVAVKTIMTQLKPEYVVHLAAISPVSYSFTHPFEVMETNFIASMNLAEVNRQFNPHLEQFLAAGTSEEYGDQDVFPIPETADLRPNSPYAVSKVAMDRYLQYLRDAYEFPMTLLRPFNTYGRINNRHFVVERIITQMLNNSEIRLGDPNPTRDMMHISDHVNAYLTCLDNEKAKRRTFNFCTGVGTSIRDLVEQLKSITEYTGEVKWHTIPPRPQDIKVLIGDNSKANRVLGWKPQVSLEKGLEKTVKTLSRSE